MNKKCLLIALMISCITLPRMAFASSTASTHPDGGLINPPSGFLTSAYKATPPTDLSTMNGAYPFNVFSPMSVMGESFYNAVYNSPIKTIIDQAEAQKMIEAGQISYSIILSDNVNKNILVSKSGKIFEVTGDNVLYLDGIGHGIQAILIRDDKKVLSGEGGLSYWSGLINIVVECLGILVTLIFIAFLAARFKGGGGMKRIKPDLHKVTFADVAGLDTAKMELREIIDFLKSPDEYKKLGAKIPRGVLLEGPPGTGKTLLAKAVAGEAHVPFFAVNATEIPDTFAAVGASRIRRIFEVAEKEQRGAIVFIDEIDTIGGKRGRGGSSDISHDREHILNQLLVEMDGVKRKKNDRKPIILIGATNRANIMDEALMRPGRFDRQIQVSRPDLNERAEAFRIHMKGKPVADGIDDKILAAMTVGMTGADIANLANEAALVAARKKMDKIDMSCFETAILRVIVGVPRPNLKVSEFERQTVAYHEAGHALVAYLLPDADKPVWASMTPHGDALGFVLVPPTDDQYLKTKAQMLSKVKVALAGRAAEILMFGKEMATSGASNDRMKALEILREMIGTFGLADGARYLGHTPSASGFGYSVDFSEVAKTEFDTLLKKEFENAENNVMNMVRENKSALVRLADAMLTKKSLRQDEIFALLAGQEKLQDAASGEFGSLRCGAIKGNGEL